MTKKELVDAVAKTANLSKAQAQEAVNATLLHIQHQVSQGNAVTITGFGKFEARMRKERISLNPRTKEQIQVPAKKAVGFKASKGWFGE